MLDKLTDKKEIEEKINAIEAEMVGADFWNDKDVAQGKVKELQKLKQDLLGVGMYDKGDAVIGIFAGAGGDDAEDFAQILYEMYAKYASSHKLGLSYIHENKNDHGGYRNITFQIEGNPTSHKASRGEGPYGLLKNESGVHRLVRISPFNAKKLRHTSFALVEVIPKLGKTDASEVVIPDADLKIEFSKSGGPGGQNVNKRETAVRIVHIPTNIAVHVDSERSQEQNREQAMSLLRGKLLRKNEEDKKKKEAGLYISKTTEIEWGSQIRSYVLHPYKMVKDHRTGFETADVDGVLNGGIDGFILAEKEL